MQLLEYIAKLEAQEKASLIYRCNVPKLASANSVELLAINPFRSTCD
jgi:hypothetical protein